MATTDRGDGGETLEQQAQHTTPHAESEAGAGGASELMWEKDAIEQLNLVESWHRYRKYPYWLAKLVFYVLLLVPIYYAFGALTNVLFPLFLSMLLAYLLDPVVDFLEERKQDRTVAIVIVMLTIIGLLAAFVAFLYPLLARQVINVIDKFPALLDSIQHQFIPWVERTLNYEMPSTLSAMLSQYGTELKSAAPSVFRKAADWGAGLASQTGVVVASLLNIVMIPIFTFYFLRDFDRMKAHLAHYIPLYRREAILARISAMDEVVGAWFRGQIQVALILAVLYGIGLGVSFGLTGHSVFDGVALGVLSGLLNIIPYVGFAVGFVLSILVVLIEWTGWGALLGVCAVFAVVQGLEGYIITPKIVGEKVGLSPVTVIIVLLIGGELAGLMGVLLAIPVAGAIKVVLPDLAHRYRMSSYYTGNDPDPALLALVSREEAYLRSDTGMATEERPISPTEADTEEEVLTQVRNMFELEEAIGDADVIVLEEE